MRFTRLMVRRFPGPSRCAADLLTDLVRAGLCCFPALRARVASVVSEVHWLGEFPAVDLLGWGVPSSADPDFDAPDLREGVWSMFHRGVVPSAVCSVCADDPSGFGRRLSEAMLAFLFVMRRVAISRFSDILGDLVGQRGCAPFRLLLVLPMFWRPLRVTVLVSFRVAFSNTASGVLLP